MLAGLDFGTSNCAIGVWDNDKPRLINLTKDSQFIASTLYATKLQDETPSIDSHELERRVSDAKRELSKRKNAFDRKEIQRKENFRREQVSLKAESEKNNTVFIEKPYVASAYNSLSDAMIERRERDTLVREARERSSDEYEQCSISDILSHTDGIVFGEEAINNHIHYPNSGRFIKSPKSFLGANVTKSHLATFTVIVTKMLENIKNLSEQSIGYEIDNVVIGKPVNFHGSESAGNKQALHIIESAAKNAGYKSVEFLYEPIAAALDYERTIKKDHVVLVLDAGGGTTDCSLVQVGPSFSNMLDRSSSILGYSGERVGGTDIDIALAMDQLMPLFGKGGSMRCEQPGKLLPLPNSIFRDAVSVNDVQSQNRFSSYQMGRELESLILNATEPDKLKRLQQLRDEGLIYRLNRSTELTKIALSEQSSTNLSLHYIEQDLDATILREQLKTSMERVLDKFSRLVTEVKEQSQVTPDVIYVTGGTAKSPIIKDWINSHFGDIEIISGDAFGSVTSGLTTWSHKIFN